MDNTELADAVVALGVGEESTTYHLVIDGYYAIDQNDEDPWMIPGKFVRDWRVAGALMELCVNKPDWMEVHIDRKCSSEATHRCWIERTHSGIERDTYHGRNKSLPRAIIEASVRARHDGENDD